MKMKRICAALVALALCCMAAGAFADAARQSQPVDESHPAVGRWQLESYSFDGVAYPDKDIAAMSEAFELLGDGSAWHTLYGDESKGTWTDEDGVISLTTDVVSYKLTFDGAALTMEAGSAKEVFVRDKSSLYALSYTAQQAMDMCNVENGGLFAIDGDALYGLCWDADGAAMLAKRTLTGDDTVIGETVALDNGCVASYLTPDSDTLYYVRAGLDGQSGIYAMPAAGGDKTCLIEGTFTSLQLYDGRLYYTDADGALSSCATDGSDVQPVLAGPVSFAYVLDGEWLLYQSGDDGETLHIRRLADGYDMRLTDTRSYLPVLKGNFLYYFEKSYPADSDKAERANICRLDMATLDIERAAGFSGAYMALNTNGFFAADGGRLADAEGWWTIENAAYDAPESAPVFANDDYLVSLRYDGGAISRVELERLSDGAAVSYNS